MNNSLEVLKQELLAQKNAILAKGGTVTVAGNNPTPAEITAGIGTLDLPAYELTNAQPSDVIAGKTFFSGNSTLKTGTLSYSAETMDIMYFYNNSSASIQNRFTYNLKAGLTYLREYAFCKNPNPVNFYFNSELEEVGDYAFFLSNNFAFPNFTSLTNLRRVGTYSFQQCYNSGIDFSALPTSLKTIGDRAFQDCLTDGMSVAIPALTTLGQYSFYSSQRRVIAGALTFDSNFNVSTLNSNIFTWVKFSNDFVIPSSVRTVSSTFNFRGGFRSITIPTTCTRLSDRCFGSQDSDAQANYSMQWVEFKATTPPTIGSSIFAIQDFLNGAYIYVPDEAVDTYKAVSNLSRYASYIKPVSEKP